MQTKNIIDGISAYVLGANMTDLIGIDPIEILIFGKMNLPKMVKPKPNTNWREPTTQKIGPKNVYGFFVKLL